MARNTIPASKVKAIGRVVERVLADSKPSAAESAELVANANEVMSRLKKVVPRSVEVIFVGSGARGTQVRGRSEIDLFLLFPRKTKREELEKKGLEYGRKIVNKKANESFVIKYAEHPYVQVYLKDRALKADIVPAYKIEDSSQMGSSVDRTQLHNRFVVSHLSKKQRDEVIVLKAFFDAHRIYGANVRVEGFSGYLSELLVCRYGSFIGVIEAFSRIKLPAVIDVLGRDDKEKNAGELVKRFNSSFIVMDPTDRNRNVAANVSDESLAKMVLASRAFMKNPGMPAFYPKGYSTIRSARLLESIRKQLGIDIYTIAFTLPDITDEILWQQLTKLRGRIELEFVKNQLGLVSSFQNMENRKGIISFMVDANERKYTAIRGPEPKMVDAAEAFIGSHRNAPILVFGERRLVAIERAKFRNPGALLQGILSQKDISFPSYIAKRGAKLYVNQMPEQYAKMLHGAIEEKMAIYQ